MKKGFIQPAVLLSIVATLLGGAAIYKAQQNTSGPVFGDIQPVLPVFKKVGNAILPRSAGYDFALGSATSTASAPFSVDISGANANVTVSGSFSLDGSKLTKTYVTVCSRGCDYTTDGTADDVQINAAILAANTNGGGCVYVKSGTYDISAVILMRSNTCLQGDRYTSILHSSITNNTVNIMEIRGAAANSLKSNVVVKDLAIQGSGQEQDGIVTKWVKNVLIEGLSMTGIRANNGANIFLYIGSSHITIQNNYIDGTGQLGRGIYVDGDDNNIFIHANDLNNIGTTAIELDDIVGPPWQFPQNVVVSNNHIVGASTYGILTEGARNITVANNTCSHCGTPGWDAISVGGADISHLGYNISVSGNIIASASSNAAGIAVSRANDVSVSGNSIKDSQGDGINALDTNDLSITANSIASTSLYAISIQASQIRDTNTSIVANVASGSTEGIRATSLGSNLTISSNTITNCSSRGMRIEGQVGGSIANNTITDCSNGIIGASTNGVFDFSVTGNVILRGLIAINLDYWQNSTFNNNEFISQTTGTWVSKGANSINNFYSGNIYSNQARDVDDFSFSPTTGFIGVGTGVPSTKFQIVGNASISSNFSVSGFASASFFKGNAFPSTNCTGSQALQWATTGVFSCFTPATGGSSPFPNGLSARVTTSGAFTHITSLSFEGNSFIFGSTASAATVKINWGSNGLASRSAANTWSALNTFSGGASFSSGVSISNYASVSNAALFKNQTMILPNTSLTLPASGGWESFNTAGRPNTLGGSGNYEDARGYWTGNVYTIETGKGGTGTRRALTIGSSGQGIISYGIASPFLTFTVGSQGGTAMSFVSTLTSTNAAQNNVQFVPTIQQSSTAGYNALLINPTVTTHGSGTQNLLNIQNTGTSLFAVNAVGLTTITASSSATTSLIDLTQPAANASVSLRLLGNNSSTQNAWSLVGGGLSGIDYDRFQIQNNGNSLFEIASNSHVTYHQTGTTTIACTAGSPTLNAGSNDQRGEFTAGLAATSCTITFATPRASKPSCWASADSATGLAFGIQPGTTTVVFSNASLGGVSVAYGCDGYR